MAGSRFSSLGHSPYSWCSADRVAVNKIMFSTRCFGSVSIVILLSRIPENGSRKTKILRFLVMGNKTNSETRDPEIGSRNKKINVAI